MCYISQRNAETDTECFSCCSLHLFWSHSCCVRPNKMRTGSNRALSLKMSVSVLVPHHTLTLLPSASCFVVSLCFGASYIVLLIGDFFFFSGLLTADLSVFFCLGVSVQRGDWPMHKLECVAMCSYGENWCPSETVRLVARMILKQVK